MKAKATQTQTMVQFHASFQTSLNIFCFTSSSSRSQKETGALINIYCSKRGRGETSWIFFFWFLFFFDCCWAPFYSFFLQLFFLVFIPLIAAEDIAQLLTPCQISAQPCKTVHGCFFYRLLFSGDFLHCLTNTLALFLFTSFYKRVEDPKQSNCWMLFTLFSSIEENISTLLYGLSLLFFPCMCL